MADTSRAYFEVKLQGRSVAARVRSVTVEDHDRLIDEATVVLDDQGGEAADVPVEGHVLLIELGASDDHAVIFEGCVTRVRSESGGMGRRATIVAYDRSYALNREPHTRDLTPGLLSAVVREVVGTQLPIGQVEPDSDHTYTAERPPPRQVGKTDWQYLQDLALAHGARCFVEYNEGRSQLYFVGERRLFQAAALGKLRFCQGVRELLEFTYERIASGAAPQRTLTSEDPATGAPAAAPAPEPPTPAPPASSAPPPTTAPESLRPRVATVGAPSDPDLPARAARRDPTRELGLFGRGMAVGTYKLRAKGKVTITGVAPWVEGDWYLRKVVHNFTADREGQVDRSTYVTRFEVTR